MKKIILTYFLLAAIGCVAQTGKFSFTFNYVNTRGFKVTPQRGTIEYTINDGVVKNIYLTAANNTTNAKDVFWAVGEKDIPQFKEYAQELKKFLPKYKKWCEIARNNNVKDYSKNVDSLLPSKPSYFVSMEYEGKRWRSGRAVSPVHFFHVSKMGTQLTIQKNKITVFALKESKGLWDDLKIITGSGMESVELPIAYLAFQNAEEVQSFIDAIDVDAIIANLKKKEAEIKRLDTLFK